MKKILMLGGAWSQIPAIRRAKEQGYYVITCDYLPENPGHAFADQYMNISTIDKERVLEFAKENQVHGVIAYASDPSAATAAYVSDKLNLPGASFDSVRLLSEKDLFRKFQKENGFKTPLFFPVTNTAEAREAAEKMKYPCMVKPVDSSGSKGVSKVEKKEQLEAAVKTAMGFSKCKRVIIEEFIYTPYHQLHGDGVVVNGKLLFAALGDQRFRNSVPIGSSLPSRIDACLLEQVYAETARLLECSGYSCGGVNIEARVTQECEIYIVEIGPRTGGNYVPQLMELATGVDEMTAVLQISMGEACRIGMPMQMHCCFQYIIGSDEKGRFQEIEMDEYIKPKVVQMYTHKKKGDWIEEYQNSSGVVGVAILRFKDIEEMEEDIKNIKIHIRVVVKR